MKPKNGKNSKTPASFWLGALHDDLGFGVFCFLVILVFLQTTHQRRKLELEALMEEGAIAKEAGFHRKPFAQAPHRLPPHHSEAGILSKTGEPWWLGVVVCNSGRTSRLAASPGPGQGSLAPRGSRARSGPLRAQSIPQERPVLFRTTLPSCLEA